MLEKCLHIFNRITIKLKKSGPLSVRVQNSIQVSDGYWPGTVCCVGQNEGSMRQYILNTYTISKLKKRFPQKNNKKNEKYAIRKSMHTHNMALVTICVKVPIIAREFVLTKDNWSQLIEQQEEGCLIDLSYMRETSKNCGISFLFCICLVCLPHANMENEPIIRPRNNVPLNFTAMQRWYYSI